MKNTLKLFYLIVIVIAAISLVGCPSLFGGGGSSSSDESDETEISDEDETTDELDIGELSFNPEPGTFSDPVDLTIEYSGSPGAQVFITIDGTDPTSDSMPYSLHNSRISINETTTIRAAVITDDAEIDSITGEFAISSEPRLDLIVEASYVNPGGSAPQLIVDEDDIPAAVNFRTEDVSAVINDQGAVDVRVNNVNIFADGTNYIIRDVVVEEFINGEWERDVEFTTSFDLLTQIAIALVLDRSNSLGDDFNDVLGFARDFVRIVKENSEDALIAVADFSTDVGSIPLTPSRDAVESYINGLSAGQFTALYSAMMLGLDLVNGGITPASGHSRVNSTTPKFIWDPVAGDDVTYQFQMDSSSSFFSPLVDETDITSETGPVSFILPEENALDIGSTYYWRWRETDGSWSSAYQFTVEETQGTAILTFTDGRDNMAPFSADTVREAILETATKSYTIGLQGRGGVDDEILEQLAVAGTYQDASNVTDLGTVFQQLSEAVSKVYQIRHTRSPVPVPESSPNQVRFRFVATEREDTPLVAADPVILTTLFHDFADGSVPESWSGDWEPDTTRSTVGGYSLSSADIDRDEESSIETTVYVTDGQTLSFDYFTSTRSNAHYLEVYVDGVWQRQFSGLSDDWDGVSIPLQQTGPVTIEWWYVKDDQFSRNADKVWIDNVRIE